MQGTNLRHENLVLFVEWYQILYALFTGMSIPLYTTIVQEVST